MYERRCEECDRLMVAYRTDARFCSAKCRVYWNRGAKMPRAMVESPRWMRWERVERAGKTTKRPVTTAGRAGSSTDPSRWSTYNEARRSSVGEGLGFALGDGVGCIDLDGCIADDGSVADWALRILEAVPATFVEVSQSGRGLHIFGELEEATGRNLRSRGISAEVYSTGRYIAVTGRRWGNRPATLAPLAPAVSVLAGTM